MDGWGGSGSNTHHRYSKTGELMDEWIVEIGRHINGWAGVVVVVKPSQTFKNR